MYRGIPDTCVKISIRFAFLLAQGSESSQSPGRMSANFVCQLSVDRLAGSGDVLRPCANSSINNPSEAATKAFEQEAILNNV
jgi:hypothetical protein